MLLLGRIGLVILALVPSLVLGEPASKSWSKPQITIKAVTDGIPSGDADRAVPFLAFNNEAEARAWLAAMSPKLVNSIPDRLTREEFLVTAHYEAKRQGLDPQMVLALIEKLSDFRKHAVSADGLARGFMQVRRDWITGSPEIDLFGMRTNLRIGCFVLRQHLDESAGDMALAPARYRMSVRC